MFYESVVGVDSRSLDLRSASQRPQPFRVLHYHINNMHSHYLLLRQHQGTPQERLLGPGLEPHLRCPLRCP